MRILNRETGTVISDVEHKTGPLQKFLGLRFRSDGRALFSFDRPTRAPIDMVFVPQPLDIAFLDDEMNVMEIHGAHPVTFNPDTWRSYRPDEPYTYALEVEAGLLPYLGFDTGHRLKKLD
ncbi:MAG: DUF192 domain-containing protein [Candidatus Nanohaloarchaea archaeon]|nr:DUF192 domain-containing protein [Candidatus Nanohaloarchaea archaeon]